MTGRGPEGQRSASGDEPFDIAIIGVVAVVVSILVTLGFIRLGTVSVFVVVVVFVTATLRRDAPWTV